MRTRPSTEPSAVRSGSRPATPQALFDIVAPRYDRLNSLLSLGWDRRWRRCAARSLTLPGAARVLDVGTGTGSLALEVARWASAGSRIVGCDLNARMLAVGRRRVRRARPDGSVCLVRCAGEALPFAGAAFDAATVAFAIDDMRDRDACAAELFRVLRPGGRVLLLELSLPDRPLLRALYRASLRVLDLVGRLRGVEGYRHLREEVVRYRGRPAIERLLRRAGFTDYRYRCLTGGAATLHLAGRPRANGDDRAS